MTDLPDWEAPQIRWQYDPKNPPLEQKELEAKIDKMVYELYGLTDEEIQIIQRDAS